MSTVWILSLSLTLGKVEVGREERHVNDDDDRIYMYVIVYLVSIVMTHGTMWQEFMMAQNSHYW